MIVAAGLLVLGGLGLFVAGVLTGETALYWACVGACVVAAVLLFLARRRMAAAPADPAAPAPPSQPAAPAAPAAAPVPTTAPPAAPTAPAAPSSGGRHAHGATVAPVTGNGAAPATTAPEPATAVPAAPVPADAGEPPVEEVEVTDLLLVVDLADEVLVVDEHPRYHVAGCAHLAGRETFPLPLDEARTDGFTPCGVCRPDATLAGRVRERRAAGGA